MRFGEPLIIIELDLFIEILKIRVLTAQRFLVCRRAISLTLASEMQMAQGAHVEPFPVFRQSHSK